MTELLTEAQVIQTFLEVTTSDDAHELTERLTTLNAYMARSGQMLAQAKNRQDRAVAQAYAKNDHTIAGMSPSIARKFIDAQCANENYLVNWLDRINRTCVHQGENIRTQISFAKEQLSLTRRGY